ncbi:MAG TPA: phosphoribosylamine--glycine ligase, partial [Terriglobales bacterium]|nr:phosphoribosylamine--glycine ligase [Terriglobales bacterium]
GGGREHALIWKLRQSPQAPAIFCSPGNGGIAQLAECLPADSGDIPSLLKIASDVKPDLIVVGPELPLAMGLADQLRSHGMAVFGPSRDAAQLEASKSFAKQFMLRHNIPTAHFAVCRNATDVSHALAPLHAPIVVKADGLAAGKGVVIARSKEEASEVALAMLKGAVVGPAGSSVVLEEFLEGEELSFLVISDGERFAPLALARDHKRVGDGDTGPNTGGMGAYSDPSILDGQMRDWLLHHVVQPTIAGMGAEDTAFSGVLFCGLMMTARGPMVLEFNCRFGDPETQAIMLRLESDLVEALADAAAGRLSAGDLKWSGEASCCIVLASAGYPGQYQAGKLISGLDEAAAMPGAVIFHAGTSQRNGSFYTAGGRVLNVCARGAALPEAISRAYAAAAKISFEGMQYRTDIGRSGLAVHT